MNHHDLLDQYFTRLKKELSSKFTKDHRMLIAATFLSLEEQFNEDQFFEQYGQAHKNNKWYSVDRMYPIIPITYVFYSLKGDRTYEELKSLRDLTKQAKFKQSPYSQLQSVLINKNSPKEHTINAAQLYNDFRSRHMFLTGGEDYSNSFLLTKNSTKSIDSLGEVSRLYYDELRKYGFSKGDSLQTASQFLTYLSNDYIEMIPQYVGSIQESFAQQTKIKSMMAPFFALLAMIEVNEEDITYISNIYNEIMESFKMSWYKESSFAAAVLLGILAKEHPMREEVLAIYRAHILCSLIPQQIIQRQSSSNAAT